MDELDLDVCVSSSIEATVEKEGAHHAPARGYPPSSPCCGERCLHRDRREEHRVVRAARRFFKIPRACRRKESRRCRRFENARVFPPEASALNDAIRKRSTPSPTTRTR